MSKVQYNKKRKFFENFLSYHYDTTLINTDIERVLVFLADKRRINNVVISETFGPNDPHVIIEGYDLDHYNGDSVRLKKQSLRFYIDGQLIENFQAFKNCVIDIIDANEYIYLKFDYKAKEKDELYKEVDETINADKILDELSKSTQLILLDKQIDEALDKRDFERVKELYNQRKQLANEV